MTSLSRTVWYAVCVVALLFLGVPATLKADDGTLKVTSFPVGANVSVDGVDTGKVTPMRIPLEVGTHTVVVSVPNSGWNPDTRMVEVVSGFNDLSVTLLPNLSAGPPGPAGADGPIAAFQMTYAPSSGAFINTIVPVLFLPLPPGNWALSAKITSTGPFDCLLAPAHRGVVDSTVANSIDEVIKLENTGSTQMTVPMMGLLSTDANVGGVNGAGIVCVPQATNANGFGIISQARIVAIQTTANTIVP